MFEICLKINNICQNRYMFKICLKISDNIHILCNIKFCTRIMLIKIIKIYMCTNL